MPLGVATRRVRQRYSKPLYTARMTAAEQAAIRQVLQLFDKHDKYDAVAPYV